MRMPSRHASTRAASFLMSAAAVVAVAGCGAAAAAEQGVQVVASTNVYGDLVRTVGGDRVEVTSVISDPSADPHSYEANVRTQLAVSRADLVIENGGGYDDFMHRLVTATDADPTVLDAVQISGLDAGSESFNEHVWYDFPAMSELTGRIADELSTIDPDGAGIYAANAAKLEQGLAGLIDQEARVRPATDGTGVAITEPVPGYLLDALGCQDRTPAGFSEAIEEGTDVAPAVLHETLQLFSSGQVQALVYNEQTSGPETQQVLDAARAAGIAVVPVTETLPHGQDYLSWMGSNLDAVVAAVST